MLGLIHMGPAPNPALPVPQHPPESTLRPVRWADAKAEAHPLHMCPGNALHTALDTEDEAPWDMWEGPMLWRGCPP